MVWQNWEESLESGKEWGETETYHEIQTRKRKEPKTKKKKKPKYKQAKYSKMHLRSCTTHIYKSMNTVQE